MENEEGFEKVRVSVLGIGGAGCNAIHRISSMGLKDVDLLAVNTDKQSLARVSDDVAKLLIGKSVTRGLGAGGKVEIGRKSLEVSKDAVEQVLTGANLVFLVAGFGGGTGTGAMPSVAEIAKKQGAVVVAFATYPFDLERTRQPIAEDGLVELAHICDSSVIIDNNRLLEIAPNLPIDEAFKVADEVIARTIKGISETILQPSLINLDFADIENVMKEKGVCVLAVGEATGQEQRTERVVKDCFSNLLLDVDPNGANSCLVHITGGSDLTLGEANEIGKALTERISENANVAYGARIDSDYGNRVEVIAIFAGVNSPFKGGKMKIEEEKDTRYAIRGKDGKIKKGIIEV